MEKAMEEFEEFKKWRSITYAFISLGILFDSEDDIVHRFQELLVDFEKEKEDIYGGLPQVFTFLTAWKWGLERYYENNPNKNQDYSKYNAMVNIFTDKLKSKLRVENTNETN